MSGKYVTLGTDSKLTAVGGANVLASKFRLAFKPGGGTLQALNNNKYVTADSSGTSALAATKDTASMYELFRWYPQPDETYQLRALSNKGFVGTAADRQLTNNGIASKYILVRVDDAPLAPPPARGKLRNSNSNSFVRAIASDPTLRVGNAEPDATIWSTERVEDSPDAAPLYTIRSTTTDLFVTADPTGASPLTATNGGAGAWEYFQFIPYNNEVYIIIHVISGNAVAAQPDGTLVDNTLDIDLAVQWAIL